MTQLPILQVLIPLLGAPLCALLRQRRVAWLLFVAAASGALVCALLLARRVSQGEVLRYALGGWPAPAGIEYVIDPVNAPMLALVATVALIVAVYARASVELEIEPHRIPLFYACMCLCLAGMLGVTATGDAFNTFVFLEISVPVVLRADRDGPAAPGAARRVPVPDHRHHRGDVPADRDRSRLRRHRHAQHGRSGAAAPGPLRKPGADRCCRIRRRRAERQDGGVPAAFLAPGRVRGGAVGGEHPARGCQHQGGDVCLPPVHVHGVRRVARLRTASGRRRRSRGSPVPRCWSPPRSRASSGTSRTCWAGRASRRSATSSPGSAWPPPPASPPVTCI